MIQGGYGRMTTGRVTVWVYSTLSYEDNPEENESTGASDGGEQKTGLGKKDE